MAFRVLSTLEAALEQSREDLSKIESNCERFSAEKDKIITEVDSVKNNWGPITKFVKEGVDQLLKETRRERPRSAPYLRLKNIQGTTMRYFEKNFFQKYLVKKSQNAAKPKKRSFRLTKRFLQTENFKKMQGGTL